MFGAGTGPPWSGTASGTASRPRQDELVSDLAARPSTMIRRGRRLGIALLLAAGILTGPAPNSYASPALCSRWRIARTPSLHSSAFAQGEDGSSATDFWAAG